MSASADDRGEALDPEACLRLLATVPIVRLGVTIDALPAVVPVAFTLEGGQLLVRTRRRTRLSAALRHAVVAVEADHYDALGHTGWHVLIQGVARPADEAEGGPWAAAYRTCPLLDDQLVAISTDVVTGRRVRQVVGPPPLGWWMAGAGSGTVAPGRVGRASQR